MWWRLSLSGRLLRRKARHHPLAGGQCRGLSPPTLPLVATPGGRGLCRGLASTLPLVATPWEARRWGQCGKKVSSESAGDPSACAPPITLSVPFGAGEVVAPL